MSRPNVADWQYLGVDKFTLGLEWNCDCKARKGHICEDTFAYGSYSSKDAVMNYKSLTTLDPFMCDLIWLCRNRRIFELYKVFEQYFNTALTD